MRFFSPFIRKPEGHSAQMQLTPGEANVRVTENIFPQSAPDPLRQGDIASRPAQNQVVTFFHDQNVAMGAADFVAHAPHHDHVAGFPRGRMTPDGVRANIKVPPHVAYGSLFIHSEPPYGFG